MARSPREAAVLAVFFRTLAVTNLAWGLFLLLRYPRAEPIAAWILDGGLSAIFFATTWIRPVYCHRAYSICCSAAGSTLIIVDAWLRQSKVTSLYGFFAILLVMGAIATFWINRDSADGDAEELNDRAT